MGPALRSLGSVALTLVVGCDLAFDLQPPPFSSSPRALVFDNTTGTRDLIEFPVLVALDASLIDDLALLDPAHDLRFFDPDTNLDLPFEVERWDPAGESLLWVKVPQIDARSQTDGILMYFGPAAGGVARPADVWTTYDLVFHGAALSNSAGTRHTPSLRGTRTAPSMIGDGIRFAPTGDQRVTFSEGGALFDGWSQFSLEMWLYPDYDTPDPPGEPNVLDKGGSLNGGRLFSPSTEGPLLLQIDMHFTTGDTYLNAYVPGQVWSHVLYTFDGSRLWLYRNGTFGNLDQLTSPGTMAGSTSPFVLGDNSAALDGLIDELRISQTYRGPDWVYAQYLSMTRRFVSFVDPSSVEP